jgi:hypothetical protein
MKILAVTLRAWLLVGFTLLAAEGQAKTKGPKEPPEKESEAVRLVVDRTIAREDELMRSLQHFRPRVETYLQSWQPDSELGSIPIGDRYFLGRLQFGKDIETRSFLPQPRSGILRPSFLGSGLRWASGLQYDLDSFAQGSLVDYQGLDRAHYQFQFVRSEFLSDLRCLVFDVLPRQHAGRGRFNGRIWVEDHDYSIVRFKGVRVDPPRLHVFFHFDSWRQELQPKLWLPVYVYAEESDLKLPMHRKPARFSSQTRFWGYDLSSTGREEELTRILVDAPLPVRDSSEAAADASPLGSQRAWESEAENNLLERLEKAGLIAPPGEVDKVLETVVNNLVVTNHLDHLPAIHARVVLTLPFESFAIGHTLVLSRGLIDVLPDEATLAAVIAHELGHIVLGQSINTKYAFNDRLAMSDEQLLEALDLARNEQEEKTADAKAIELLKNSPYKDSLSSAGLFLRAMANECPQLQNLFGAHLGNSLAQGSHLLRLPEVEHGAPQLQPSRVDQIAALPLGSRLVIDAWSGRVELAKSEPVKAVSAREKLPFRVTPLFPDLTRRAWAPAAPPIGKKATAEIAQPQN